MWNCELNNNLRACHIAQKMGAFHIHLSPSNSMKPANITTHVTLFVWHTTMSHHTLLFFLFLLFIFIVLLFLFIYLLFIFICLLLLFLFFSFIYLYHFIILLSFSFLFLSAFLSLFVTYHHVTSHIPFPGLLKILHLCL